MECKPFSIFGIYSFTFTLTLTTILFNVCTSKTNVFKNRLEKSNNSFYQKNAKIFFELVFEQNIFIFYFDD